MFARPQGRFVEGKTTGCSVGEIGAQAECDALKSQRLPGNILFSEQDGLQCFHTGCEITLQQAATIKQMHLTDVRNIDQREEFLNTDMGAGFLQRFPLGRFAGRFAVLHETGRQGPQTRARFDRSPAQQNPFLPLGDAADDQLRIQVMHAAAIQTNVAWHIVSGRNR